MLGSPEEKEASHERASEDIFEPEIVCVHSHSLDNLSDTCSRCISVTDSEPLQSIADPENQMHIRPSRTDYDDGVAESDSLSEEEEEEIEKENEKIEGIGTDKNDLSRDDINSKLRFIFHLDGLKESGGLLYIGCECDKEKTNPSKIMEWFSTEFLNLHRVYAIREDEPFLLKVFTRNHEITNRGIRKKGGRKVMLMGKEVFGDVFLACGHCGYWSREGSNVRRHLKKSVCLKDRGYCKEELAGLDRVERRRFLRRVAAAKCRAKKKARAFSEGAVRSVDVEGSTPEEITTIAATITTTCATTTTASTAAATTATTTTTTTTANTNATDTLTATSTTTSTTTDCLPCSLESSEGPYAECLVEIQENSYPGDNGEGAKMPTSPQQQRTKRRLVRHKALMLGPAVTPEAVLRAPYDIFTINENNERVAWKPPQCHKISPGDCPCQIVFKGARMKRRCLDLPVPRILIYRKLDCKTHHCNFTLFHPSARAAFHCDNKAKASIDIKMYGDIVMTQEFYHYFVSLLSIMKMKSSQTARHLTSVWETILAERLGTSTIPEEYRKIITLSKQTVKSIWSSIEEETESRGGVRLSKGSRRRKKLPPPVLPSSVSVPLPLPLALPSNVGPFSSTVGTADACGMTQPSSAHHCMKRLNPIAPKPPPLPPPPPIHPPPPTHPPPSTHVPPSPHKSSMMPLPPPPPPPHPHPHPHPHPPPHPSHHNSMQQAAPHPAVNHTHWLGQAPQYPHNMTPYPMTSHPSSAEYYPVPSHFMTQYTPATMGTSP